MNKQKLIPLLGAVVLLASCGGGNNVSGIELSNYKTKDAEMYLASDVVDLKKDTQYNFIIDFSKYKDDDIDTFSGQNSFYIGDINAPVEGLDCSSVKIKYNNKELKSITFTEYSDFDNYCDNIKDKKAGLDETFAAFSEGGQTGVAFALYSVSKSDKAVISVSFNKDVSARAIHWNNHNAPVPPHLAL